MEARMDNSDSPGEDKATGTKRPAAGHTPDWAHDQDAAWNEFPDDWDPAVDSRSPQSAVADNERLVAMLCYVTLIVLPFIFPIIVLLSPKRTLFQTFHAVQSLGLGLGCGMFWLGLGLGAGALIFLFPIVGTLLAVVLLCLLPLTWILAALLALLFAYRAFQGQYAMVPLLYAFMRAHGWIPTPAA